MRIIEFHKLVTAQALNENALQVFGQKLNLESFTLEQLYDARNKLRTRIHSFESTNGYSAVYEDENHNKNKSFLNIVNTEIEERESRPEEITFTEIEQMVLDRVKEGLIEFAQLPEELQEKVSAYGELQRSNSKSNQDVPEGSDRTSDKVADALAQKGVKYAAAKEQEIIDMIGEVLADMGMDAKKIQSLITYDQDFISDVLDALPNESIKEGSMKDQMHKDAERMSREKFVDKYGDENGEFWDNIMGDLDGDKYKSESLVTEGEEEKAEFIMSTRDIVDRITGWMEDTANMQAENMLKLVDAIRDEMGSDVAMEFESIMKPALATVYTALENSRQQLTQGVGLLTGENNGEMMGAEPTDDFNAGDDLEPDDLAAEPDEAGTTDEFGAAAPSAGGAEEAGRAKRESVEFGRRLAVLLAPKKK